MSEDNSKSNTEKGLNRRNSRKKLKKKKKRSGFKTFLLVVFFLIIVSGSAIAGMVLSIISDAPDIDPTTIASSLDQTSTILTEDGQLIEKIQAPEYRTVVSLDKVPKHLQDAFIAIEDERFYKHIGIDPKGIASSAIENIKAGQIVRGASTITQQLVKNVYLTREKSWERKIKEAYLALKVERVLTKDQILELYLNRIFLGQNAYGVQEAAQAYFSKDVGDLTIAESALIAGIAKSSASFAPYQTIYPEDFDPNKHDDIAHMNLMGEKFVAIYNPKSIERQKLVLNQMLNLGKISQAEYQEALGEDIRANLKPAEKQIDGISSYFADYVKKQVIDVLVNRLDYSEEDARNELYTGGLKIYSTIDIDLQKELEHVYDNFTQVLVGNTSGINGPVLVDWRRNSYGDIIDKANNILYYSKSNLLNENNELILNTNEYKLENDSLILNSSKLRPYNNNVDVADFYSIDENKNLVTHPIGSISFPEEQFSISSNGDLIISSDYLSNNEDFYRIDGNGNLLINSKYFPISETGIVQPQSATVVLDYKQGHIKAIVGGRDVKGAKMLNRATDSRRQPGSVMKPLAAYLPALDNGYTAATPIDDIPFYNNGKLWPRNWYGGGYKGLMTLRYAVEQSANVPSVKVVEQVGVKTSMKYLEKMGIIKNSDPLNDSFVTAKEDPQNNDENLSALGLGGMTKGLTPLEVTSAFGAIANNGVYIEPMTFTKIEDKNGEILIDDTRVETKVISPDKAYVLKDILRTTVTNGIAGRAQVPGMATSGKTGTTENQADIWFAGFTPYYATAVWIGNDSPAITVSRGSGTAAQLWQHIMVKMHDGKESITSYKKPEGVVTASVCKDSGLKPSSLCGSDPRGGRVYTEIFAKGTAPTKTCDVHVSASIDTSTGKLATEFCPSEFIQTGVFIKRKPPYNPANHGGIVPSDYQYSTTGGVCDVHDASSLTEDDELEDDDSDEDLLDEDESELENTESENDGEAVEFPLEEIFSDD